MVEQLEVATFLAIPRRKWRIHERNSRTEVGSPSNPPASRLNTEFLATYWAVEGMRTDEEVIFGRRDEFNVGSRDESTRGKVEQLGLFQLRSPSYALRLHTMTSI